VRVSVAAQLAIALGAEHRDGERAAGACVALDTAPNPQPGVR
jgi:hypothetical protein